MKLIIAAWLIMLMPSLSFGHNEGPAAKPEIVVGDPVPLVLVVTANMKTAVNRWLQNRLGFIGENLTIELIGTEDDDWAPPTHYASNWGAFAVEDRDMLANSIGNSPNVSLFSNGDFGAVIASLGLRVRPIEIPYE